MPCVYHESPEEIREGARRALNRQLEPLQAEIDMLKHDIAVREAMLCGVLTTVYFLDGYQGAKINLNGMGSEFSYCLKEYFDEAEAGVSWAQLESWWVDHQEQDRRRREAEAAILAARRAAALVKLTPEERELLGLL